MTMKVFAAGAEEDLFLARARDIQAHGTISGTNEGRKSGAWRAWEDRA